MKEYRSYLDDLYDLLTQVAEKPHLAYKNGRVVNTLNGEPSEKLRMLVPLEQLRASGAYFTNPELRQVALKSFIETIDSTSVILDPACGAGDLLLGCVERIPQGKNFSDTLSQWGERIVGRDIHPEFIRATKVRLLLAVLSQMPPDQHCKIPSAENFFPNVVQSDGLTSIDAIKAATHIVLNPPFTLVAAPDGCQWGSGLVNAAAVFLETCVKNAESGTRIAAILPDVLRSGSNYKKWRTMIEQHTREERIVLYGSFDDEVDVDVFVIELVVEPKSDSDVANRWYWREATTEETVGDHFDVRVGPVVDYRHPHTGPVYPFIRSRALPAWTELTTLQETRKFTGTVFSGPFVVVRRTSRLRDKHRAVATLIDFPRPVAVENHLLVLLPKDGSTESCRSLIDILNSPATTDWLNDRIRCRHLTISSLAGIPWRSSEHNG